jgi:hypothetical protein
MVDDRPGVLARLAGLVGLAEQTQKMIELGTSAVDLTTEVVKGQQAGRAHERRLELEAVRERHRERHHSRTRELMSLAASFDWTTKLVDAGIDVVTNGAKVFFEDQADERRHARNLERIAAETTAAQQLELHRVVVTASVIREMAAQERALTNSPFADTADVVHDRVVEATDGGRRPVLLIAPFYHEEGGPTAPGFVVALRQSWLTSGWHDDLAPLAGLLNRPLEHLDVDLQVVQQALHDLPVVLVHGQVQDGGRVWPALSAWNIAPGTGGSSLHLTFPSFDLPDAGDRRARLELGDTLGRMFALTAGNLGDWFHLLHHGRAPQVHRMVAAGEDAERHFLATSAADAYDVLLANDQLTAERVWVRQARTLADGGLPDVAGRIAATALDRLGDASALPVTTRIALLSELVGVFALLAEKTRLARTELLLEQASQARLDQLYGWSRRDG